MPAGSILHKRNKHHCKEMACSLMVTEMAFTDHQMESMITRETLVETGGDHLA